MSNKVSELIQAVSGLDDSQLDWLINQARTKWAWRDEPASPKQMEWIKRLIDEGRIHPVSLDGLTKGTASDMLGGVFGDDQKKRSSRK